MSKPSSQRLVLAIYIGLLLIVLPNVNQQKSAEAAVTGSDLSVGPVAGAVTSTQASVFLRTAAANSAVVQYSTDSGMANPVTSNTVQTGEAGDFSAIIGIGPLQPLTKYYLNLVVGGVAQISAPYPSFTTFPAPGTAVNFNFIYLTDFANLLNGASGVAITPAFQSAAADNPAFAFIGGDYDHRGAVTLAGHRLMYQQLYDPNSYGMADYVNYILDAMPIVHQWDDHDSGPDNLDRTFSFWNDDYTAFTEYFPMYDTAALPPAIWEKFTYGRVDFFVLDCRSQRDNEYDVDGINKSMLDGNHLGPAGELAWLENGLLMSRAEWKIIFSSVPVNATTKYPDNWAGYHTEWNSIRHFINLNKIKNVSVISGDLHSGGIDDGVASGVPEMVVPNVNIITPSTGRCSTGSAGVWSQGTYANPAGSCRGYGLGIVTSNPDQLTLQVKDENGNVRISYTMNAK